MDEPIVAGYGHVSADEDSEEVTPDTCFMIASISKVFGGASVMKLIEDGLIESADDDICNVLPDDYDSRACDIQTFQIIQHP
jgi:CubicO group peptidase (beta-lactamase class C family)